MKIIQPVLFVSGDDEMATAILAKDSWKKDWDVLIPYEYQRKHFEMIFNYVAPEYYQKCPVKDTLENSIKEISGSAYREYFMYFLVSFMIYNKQGGYDPKLFQDWLDKKHSLYIGRRADILRYYDVRKYYQTIVIDLNIGDGNKWNRLCGLTPNYFGQHTIFYILQYLSDGGKVIFVNIKGNMKKIFDYTRVGYEEIEEDIFRKIPSPKKKFKIARNWL